MVFPLAIPLIGAALGAGVGELAFDDPLTGALAGFGGGFLAPSIFPALPEAGLSGLFGSGVGPVNVASSTVSATPAQLANPALSVLPGTSSSSALAGGAAGGIGPVSVATPTVSATPAQLANPAFSAVPGPSLAPTAGITAADVATNLGRGLSFFDQQQPQPTPIGAPPPQRPEPPPFQQTDLRDIRDRMSDEELLRLIQSRGIGGRFG